MAKPVQDVFDKLEEMSVLDLLALKRKIEDEWGITAQAPVVPPTPDPTVKTDEPQTSFDVVLTEFGSQKLQVIKAIREATGLGLKEAKDLVEAAPVIIKEGVTEDAAAVLRTRLEEAGATVSVG